MAKQRWTAGLVMLGAACSSGGGTQPPLPACTTASGGQVALGVAFYMAIDPTQTAGCAVFPANPVCPMAEYLVVPQSASTIPDDSQAFKLGGNPLAAPPAPAALAAAGPGAAQQRSEERRVGKEGGSGCA